EPLDGAMDLSRTVGWFTSVYPVRLDVGGLDPEEIAAGGAAAGEAVKRVKEQVRRTPGDGLGWGMLRWLNPQTRGVLQALPAPRIGFNYLGRFRTGGGSRSPEPWQMAGEDAVGGSADPGMPAQHQLEAGAVVRDTPDGPELNLTLSWPGKLLDGRDVIELGDLWVEMLTGIARHTTNPGIGGHTPSDFPLVSLNQ